MLQAMTRWNNLGTISLTFLTPAFTCANALAFNFYFTYNRLSQHTQLQVTPNFYVIRSMTCANKISLNLLMQNLLTECWWNHHQESITSTTAYMILCEYILFCLTFIEPVRLPHFWYFCSKFLRSMPGVGNTFGFAGHIRDH